MGDIFDITMHGNMAQDYIFKGIWSTWISKDTWDTLTMLLRLTVSRLLRAPGKPGLLRVPGILEF